ncbi:MAG: outer membrane beta-barrel protein [Candidatus Solibacter usitatus]|nr:outer membrane beta-barrel protein [Candidatus Solibacter usitatus]
MRGWAFGVLLCASAAVASAQVGEFSVSGGGSHFGSASLGESAGALVDLHDGFHMALRFTLNTYKFFGHEFGYGYSHSNIQIHSVPVQDNSTSIHQGFYDFLVYATPEGSRIRPFGAAGVNFSSFYPPGASVYGGGQTKFGLNLGAGIKVKVNDRFNVRLDVRDYNTGKPFNFDNVSGRLNQIQVSVGVGLLF